MIRCSNCGAHNRLPPVRPSGQAVCGRCKADLVLSFAPQEVGVAELERAVAQSPVPVLVDFWAPWCYPCRLAAPSVAKLAAESGGNLLVLKVNTQEHPSAQSRFGVQGIPTFVLFANGRELTRRAGAMPYPELARWTASFLPPSAPAPAG